MTNSSYSVLVRMISKTFYSELLRSSKLEEMEGEFVVFSSRDFPGFPSNFSRML